MKNLKHIPGTLQITFTIFILFLSLYSSAQMEAPLFFDVKVSEKMYQEAEAIKPWKTIELDSALAGTWIVAGDVNNDGEPEIVSARNVNIMDDHYTSSVIVYDLDGRVLWQWGDPAKGRNSLHHDVACQIYDWDGNGINDVIVAADKSLIELDGISGRIKRRIPIQDKASDCIVFANLSGNDRATDIIVKTRYDKIWAYNSKGENIWMVRMPAGKKTAHRPVPVDVDNDGRDELMAGYALLNSDGSIRWNILDSGIKFKNGHLDCADEFPKSREDEETRLAITCCGDHCIGVLNSEGEMIWKKEGYHYESIDIGKIYPDVPGYQIVVDIDHRPWGESPLWVLSEKGEWLGQIITDRSRQHLLIDWEGKGLESIVIAQTCAMFNGKGEMAYRFDIPGYENKMFKCFKGDMTGDGVPDLIFSTRPAHTIYIYKNPREKRESDNLVHGTGINYSFY